MAGQGCSRLNAALAAPLRSMRPWASRWIAGDVGGGEVEQPARRAKARISGSLRLGASIR